MKWLVYDGPHLEVEVPHDNVPGGLIVAARGKAVQVPDNVAESLLTHGEETGVPVDADGNERSPVHQRTWRAATAKETKAAEGTAPAAADDKGEEVAE